MLSYMYNQAEESSSLDEINRSLTDACIGVIVKEFKKSITAENLSLSRKVMITKQFRSLLLQSFRVMKSPSLYAESLNISPSYLNEVVKKTTGFSASYWINQEIVLEAKRVLFHTDCSVKEVAEQLGYEDYSYFTRVFTKIAGMSPIAFRQKYRK
jgi:AraC family transcriptional activator of pobA